MKNIYNIQSYNRAKLFCRIHYGLNLLFYYPFLFILLIFEFVIFIFLWNIKIKFIPSSNFYPVEIKNIFILIISVGLLLILILFWIATIVSIASFASRKDEANLEKVFTDNELQHGCPILFSRTQKDGITIRDFYSPIPLFIWEEKKARLCHSFNCHLINPEIEYGGKNANNGKYIRLYSAPGINKKDRGILYANDL